MKTRLCILLVAVTALFCLSAGISAAKVPGPIFGTDDSCAASFFTEDASACGNGDTIPLVGEYCCYNGGTTRLCQYSGWAFGSYYSRSIEQHVTQGCAPWINPW